MVLPSIEAIRSALVPVTRAGARRSVLAGVLTLGTVACSVYEPGLLPQELGVAGGGGAAGGNGATTRAGADPSLGGAAIGGGGAAPGGAPGSAGAAGTSSAGCAGVVYEDMCWYLGDRGKSCDATCARHGAVDERGASVVGTTAQGGSLDGCSQVLDTLGMSVSPTPAVRNDVGLGCHLYDADAYWLDEPSFATNVSQVSSRLVCACRH